jgi:hypothetical protein
MTITPAAPLTARPGYQAAGRDVQGRICRETFHAVLTGGTLRVGFASRHRGEALCGAAPVGDCPAGLFPPVVTCRACRAIAGSQHVQIQEDQQ